MSGEAQFDRDGREQPGGQPDGMPRYSRVTRRLGYVLACIAEEPIGFAVPLFALLIFVSAPQMPDMFARIGALGTADQHWSAYLRSLSLGLGAAIQGFLAWYWTRAALMGRERINDSERHAAWPVVHDKSERDPDDWAREWTPRIALLFAALTASTPLLEYLNNVSGSVPYAPIFATTVGIGFIVVAFLITRYRLPLGLAGGVRASPILWRTRTTSILSAAPFGWPTAVLLLGISLLGAWIAAYRPGWLDSTLDTPTAGLIALGFIVGPLVVSLAILRDLANLILLIFTLPLRVFTRFPYLDEFSDVAGALLLLFILYTPTLVLLSRWQPPEFYKVRTTEIALEEGGDRCASSASRVDPAPLPAPIGTIARPTLKEALISWNAAKIRSGYPIDRALPVIIIAAEGGASRAAVWLLSTMRFLDQRTEGQFGRHLFAISGVSGGSLGAVTYLQALNAYARPDGSLDWSTPAVEKGLSRLADADLLTAPITTFFLNDTFGRMFGRYWNLPDRGTALERAFEREWIAAKGFKIPSDVATGGVIALQQRHHSGDLPHLFLNGTDAATGQRLITSTVRFDQREDLFAGSDDLLGILERDVPASVAVTNSSRFPYLSPAGRFYDKCKGQRQVVDGGYFENYGARTASELAARISSLAMSEPELNALVPIVVVVSNDASAYRTEEEARQFRGASLRQSAIACTNFDQAAPPASVAATTEGAKGAVPFPGGGQIANYNSEGVTPLLGLYAAHVAYGEDALHILRRQLCPAGGSDDVIRLVHIALPKPNPPQEAAPLNWVLNDAARHFLLGETGVFDVEFNAEQANDLARSLDRLRNSVVVADRTGAPHSDAGKVQ